MAKTAVAVVEKPQDPLLTKLQAMFKAAKRVSTPIIGIQSLDATATIASIGEMYPTLALVRWDIVRGAFGLNEAGTRAILDALPPIPRPEPGEPPVDRAAYVATFTTNPVDMLKVSAKFPRSTLLFMLMANNYLESETVQQAIWNRRDENKLSNQTLILIDTILRFPPSLAQDILILDEPMPTPKDIETIILGNIKFFNEKQVKSAQPIIEIPDAAVLERAVDAALGLPAFAADQATAMNITETGVDIGGIWNWKIGSVGSIKGLSVHRGAERYSDYVGNEYAKELQLAFINGKKRHKGIVLFDEIDKAFAGNAGDNTGVSGELHGAILELIEDLKLTALLYHGVWGSGKSHLVKSGRNEARGGEIIMLKASLPQVKSGIVGSSMINFLTLWKSMMAMCADSPLLIFTCNTMATLSAEFLSRMKVKLFFDLPGKEELDALWKVNIRNYGLDPNQPLPACDQWTGRDVRNCAEMSWELGLPLLTTAQAIVPQAIGSRAKLQAMRAEANGTLLSAVKPGLYYMPEDLPTAPQGGRLFSDN